MEKKFLGSTGLTKFLENLYEVFEKVGHTHTKSQIIDFPTIPTKVSQLDNDSGFVSTDTNTKYTLTKDGDSIILTGTDGTSSSVKDSDTTITVDSEISSTSMNPVQNKVIKATFDEAKLYTDSVLKAAKSYTDTEIADLINSAPATLDTLGEIAIAMDENADVVEALDNAVGSKASKDELNTHVNDVNVHVTDAEKELWNSAKEHAESKHVSSWNDLSDKPNYAGSSSEGGAATSANKLNTNAGSDTQPVYFADGVPVATAYTLGKSVPSNAIFTDTTYSEATTTSSGLMSAADKVKLDGLSENVEPCFVVQSEVPEDTSVVWIDIDDNSSDNENGLCLSDVERELVVQDVLAAMGMPVLGKVDNNNNIILSGNLEDGVYTLKYEHTNGILTTIGTLNHETNGETDTVVYTNLADPTSEEWLFGYRLRTSGEITSCENNYVTNVIPCKPGDVIRVKGLDIAWCATGGTRTNSWFLAEDRETIVAIANVVSSGYTTYEGWEYDGANAIFTHYVGSNTYQIENGSTSDIRYFRFNGQLFSGYTENDVIITVNEKIL